MILPTSPTAAHETLVLCLFGEIKLLMSVEAYEVGERSDKRGVDLISDVLPFGSPVVSRVKRSQQRG